MKNFTILLSCIILLLNSDFLFAQPAPTIEWQKCLGGSLGEQASSIQQTKDNGFIIAGYSGSNDSDVSGNHGGVEDYWIVRLDSMRNIIWQRCLGGSDFDFAQSIVQTSDDGFIVAGWSASDDGDVSGNHGAYDYWIVKLDSGGNIVWQKPFGGTGWDLGTSVQQTTDGGYIVAGSSHSHDGDVTDHRGRYDYWILKLDSAGNLLWQKSIGGTRDDYANSVQQTTDGGFIVAGQSDSYDGDVTGNHGNSDFWIVKLNSEGNLIWQKSYGGSNDEDAYSIQQATDGGFIVAGWTASTDGDVSGYHGGLNDYWVIRLDTNGNLIWQKTLGGSGDDIARSVRETKDGGFIVAGWSNSKDGDVSQNNGYDDYWIVKLDRLGNLIWQKSLGGTLTDQGYCIENTNDNGFIVAGEASSDDDDVSGNHGEDDYWIVKLSPEIATGISSPILNSISLFPNPSPQNQLTINLSSPANESTVSVYDLQGRNMNEKISVSDFTSGNSIQINTQQLPPGFYTVQIINNKTGQKEIGKFVKE